MSFADADRQVARFVAGLPVDAEALAAALAARSLDRVVVSEALLAGLAGPAARMRLATARRSARMAWLTPRVAALLARMAVEDDDEDVQDACRAALRTHGAGADEDPRDRR